ncbi:MAG: 30S ribosomal protein S20 [bacterium]
MPIIQSAIKRVRQQAKRRSRNLATKRQIKSSTKLTLAAVAANDITSARAELAKAISQIDKAIKKGTLHKNTGARRKSRLTIQYNAASDVAYGVDKVTKAKASTPAKPAAKKAPAKATTKKPATKKPAAKK